MALYINGNKVVNSLIVDGDKGVSHSLVNKSAVATSSTARYKDRVDANNYISVSGNTVTLTRNNASNWLSFYTDLLEAGKSYAFIFDSITNTDSNIYIGTVSDISANPYSVTRIRTESLGQNTVGWVVTPTVSGVYDFLLGDSNLNPIICVNPRLIALDEVAGTPVPTIKVHSGKVNLATGAIVDDADYCYTDFIDFSNGYQMFDFGETAGAYVGCCWYKEDGTYGGNYWSANARFRYVDNSSYYSNGVRKQRLTFRRVMLEKVIFFDNVTNKTYTFNPIKLEE